MKVSQSLLPSLLDRLIDDTPLHSSGIAQSFTWQKMRKSVRQDLENLLNAKGRWHIWPKHFQELDHSLFSYGLPDFSTMPLSSLDGKQALCQSIEETIRKFEPRFADVAVTIVGDELPEDRILRLRIHALFHATPEPEEVTFDSEIEPVYLGIKISEA
ncbi:type VI secretion system baseplate subunit TssE [Photobacterium makurazakiensis]|uniref:type VI secretion system baseplate subunit TssE n=1 Tax=Photobacterium makurazakiensis TaxID=2910234 RepID=UPI003D0E2CD6